jgi:glutamyl-Q tRNA(Asp) synthetase
MAYPCNCSRRDLADAPRGPLGVIYPGTCRSGCPADEFALRVRTEVTPIEFVDQLQGQQAQSLESESGDFVILRRDGLIAYQLAVVVDDYLQGITDVVRGIDLLDSTPRQIWLQRLLGYPTPQYCHLPVAINERGQKLSKSHGAAGVPLETAADNLFAALTLLGQPVPSELRSAPVQALWEWGLEHWNLSVLSGITDLPAPSSELA